MMDGVIKSKKGFKPALLPNIHSLQIFFELSFYAIKGCSEPSSLQFAAHIMIR